MNTYLYIAVMALTTYAIRVLPLTLIRKPIKSTFLRSFLYYVPYVTLAVMDLPRHFRGYRLPHCRSPRDAGRHCERMAGDGTSAGFAPLLRNRPRTAISHLICCIDTRKAAGEDAGGLRVLQLLGQSAFSSAYCFSQIRRLGRIRLYRVGTCRSVSTKCGNSSTNLIEYLLVIC